MRLTMDPPDTAEWNRLVDEHYPAVLGLARRMLGNDAEARDAAQETFARAFKRIGEFDRTRRFPAWILTIAANHIRDLLRRRRGVALDAETQQALPDLTPPDAAILREENRAALHAAVDRLADEIENGGDDPELRKRLQTTKISLSFADSPLSEVAAFLGDFLGVAVIIEANLNRMVDLDLTDVTAESALESLAAAANVHYVLVKGVIQFQKNPPVAAGFLPVRLPVSDETRRAVADAIGKLDDDSIDARAAAAQTLAEAGFAAERPLWIELGSKNDPVRASCAAALENLYERRTGLAFDPSPSLETLKAARLTLDQNGTPLQEVLEDIARETKVAIFLDAGLDWSGEPVALKVKDLSGENTLKLLLGYRGFEFALVGNSVFVSQGEERLPVRTRPLPQSTLWLEEEHATLVALLEAADAVKLSKLGIADVAAIRWAQGRVGAQTAEPLESAVREILSKSDRWSPDERTPIAKLANRIKLDLQAAPVDEILKALSKEAGVEIRLAKDAPMPTTYGIQAVSISIAEALDLMTLPYGCVAVEAGGAVEIRKRQ